MVHLSTQPHRVQTGGWKKILLHLYRDILCNVGKGWFSLDEEREEDWPFWSHFIFMFGWVGRGADKQVEQHSCVVYPYPTK